MDLNEIISDFNERVQEYDKIVNEVVPFYKYMLETMIAFIPFEDTKEINVLDLGCGVGNTTDALLNRYTNAKVTCVDLAPNALNVCLKRFQGKKVTVVKADIRDDSIHKERQYDCVISSLAIHHLQSEQDKLKVYRNVFKSLKKGGFLIVAENVHGSNSFLTKIFEKIWIRYMSDNGLNDNQIKQYYSEYLEKDYPSPLLTQLEMLKLAGFIYIDCIWKYSFFSIFCGSK